MNDFIVLRKIYGYLKYQKDVWGNHIYLEKASSSSNQDLEKASNSSNQDLEIANDSQSDINNSDLDENWQASQTIDELNIRICHCKQCELGETRNNFVFGTGNPNADIMFIGEGPGADEDKQGKPFVGKAGQLLTKIIQSIEFEREEVFIANIVKCRPPGNRRPLPTEVETCIKYLHKQIELIKPAFIVALGLTAIDGLLGKAHKMSEMRGKLLDYHNAKLLVTYHPAALLRNPSWKAAVWEDVKLLKKLYIEYKNNQSK